MWLVKRHGERTEWLLDNTDLSKFDSQRCGKGGCSVRSLFLPGEHHQSRVTRFRAQPHWQREGVNRQLLGADSCAQQSANRRK